jgi:predicted DNA-binding antitoxin AbrB/MazE fold protein
MPLRIAARIRSLLNRKHPKVEPGAEVVMQERIRAVVNDGRIEPVDKLDLPDGTQVLVTVLPNGDDFLLRASEVSLNAIWDNPEDDVYAELLER